MISAVVVLFKPADNVYQNIMSYLHKVDRLYLIDNSPILSDISKKLQKAKSVELLSSLDNIGLAEAYNLALKKAHRDSYRWLMTMDQDSFFEPQQLESYLEDFDRVSKERLALYAPLHNPKFIRDESERSVLTVMSSGSIVNVEYALGVDAFDTALFIDEVDHEFCLRLGENGYTLLQNPRVYIDHQLGEDLENGRKKYSATRLYYMVRNYLYLKKRYKKEYPDFFAERDIYMRRFISGQVVYHRNRLRRIVMIGAAFRDYYLGRMGKRMAF